MSKNHIDHQITSKINDYSSDKNHNPRETFYETENIERKKNESKFNSITQKSTPENQNQTHNVRKEASSVKMRQV